MMSTLPSHGACSILVADMPRARPGCEVEERNAQLNVVTQWVARSGGDDLQGACLLPDLAGLLPQSTLAWHQRIVGFLTIVISPDRLRSVGHPWCSCHNWAVVGTSASSVDDSLENSHDATKSRAQ